MKDEERGAQGLVFNEPVLFEIGSPGRRGTSIPAPDVEAVDPADLLPAELVRDRVDGLPELSEVDVVRHFTHLSQWNFGVDSGMYPLGSCTMKYNPKVNEEVAALEGLSAIHPYQPETTTQGALELLYRLERGLAELSGMDRVTLQPAAGAQGEFVGIKIVRAFHEAQGDGRRKILIPDTAHGTNPASSALCGYEVVSVVSGNHGVLEPEAVAAAMDEDVAALMLTNPNTLGLFETHIAEVAEIVHGKGGLVYCDGANMNAVMGAVRPGDTGVDVIHLNLHKTFSTPHGGGGPGAGPVGVRAALEAFLPVPLVVRDGEGYRFDYDRPRSIGRVKAFYGNFAVLVRAFAYLLSMGAEGLTRASEMAVLSANYIKQSLRGAYHLPFDETCMHECIFTDKRQTPQGVKTMDIVKRLIDYGFHPPTVYFPLVVSGAIMIEPTETESREELDRFIHAMLAIAEEVETSPETVRSAPHRTKVSRLDEVRAARRPRLRWTPPSTPQSTPEDE